MRKPRRTILVGVVAAILLFPAPSVAQGDTPCSDTLHSAFDFWIGEWEVRLEDGSLVGHNTIRKRADDCNLAEDWRGTRGSTGQSLNFVDPVDGRWHQLWVGSGGLVLRLEGGPREGGMRMEGRGRDTTRLHRISWTPLDDGRVRQHWEVSQDQGESWSDVFDGFYTPLPTPRAVDAESADRCDTPQGRRFDFWPGEWRVESRLRVGAGEWHQTQAVWRAEEVIGGCGFLDYTTGDYGRGPMSGVGSRFYNPETDRWIVTWVSTENPGSMGVWEGRFEEDGTGDFFRETQTAEGVVHSRIRWTNVREGRADWSYAVSSDGGDTWTTMWEMQFRALDSASAAK